MIGLSRRCVAALALMSLVALAGPAHAAANLVVNGSFEAYTHLESTEDPGFFGLQPDGWGVKHTFDGHHAVVEATPAKAHHGSAYYKFMGLRSEELYQDIPTRPGVAYTLSFFLMQYYSEPVSDPPGSEDFYVSWGGGSAGNYSRTIGSIDAYTPYSTTVVGGPGETTRLTFFGHHNATYWGLDDVRIVEIPEPAAAAIVGLGALALLRRRR